MKRRSTKPKPIKPDSKCKVCGKKFVQLGGGSPQKYCSIRCRNAAFYKSKKIMVNTVEKLEKENKELRKKLEGTT